MNLVTKIYFPREILPIASVGAAFVDFLMAALVLAGLMLVYGFYPTVQSLWVFPLLLVQITLSVAVTLLGSTLIVFQRDIRFVIPLLTQIWMYATPIIYPVDLVPEQWQTLYFLNPMAGIIDGYRRALLEGLPPRADAVAIGTVVTLFLLVSGYYLFKRAEPVFADLI
jgi:lipopolysaccharide transport system permease protein